MPDQDRRSRTEGGAPVMDAGAWAAAVLRGETLAGVAIRRAEAGADVVRAVDMEARTIEIIAGTSSVVRDSMAILVEGYDLSFYRQNPVVPWSHCYWEPPVAKCVDMRVEGNQLICRDLFVPGDISPFADMLWKMYSHQERFLRAASIGLNPLEHEQREGVLTVTRSEVMEHSLCLIGVDPSCLTLARSAGIDVQPMDEWCRRVVLDEGDQLVLSRARAEAIVRALGYGNGLALFELDPVAIEALRAEPVERDEPRPKRPKQREEGEGEPAEEEKPAAAEPGEEERRDDGDDSILLEIGEDEEEVEEEDIEVDLEVDEEEVRAAVASLFREALAAPGVNP